MKSLIFMMLLTMAAVSAGVVYLSINRDPLGGAPHVDVTLDAPPQEEAKAEPEPEPAPAAEEITAAAPAEPAAPAEAAADPLIASPTGALATGTDGDVSIELPADDTGEPLTTTAFPIPELDAADPALTTGEPAAVDQ